MRLLKLQSLFLGGFVFWSAFGLGANAQDQPEEQNKRRVYFEPKVQIPFNTLYDYPEMVEILEQLVEAHPELLSMESLGKSVEGRDLWCVTINNPETGPDTEKPAMYVDGNIHGNEVQASEACLYLIWYLTENYGRLEKVTQMVDERAFYVVPTINPDGRAWWFNGPNTNSSSRSGKAPVDLDRDGQADEDGYDDIDGDGQITQMRRLDPNGPYKVSSADPRILEPITQLDEGRADLVRYELLGYEGFDRDGDGRVNEDPPGGYDMNRNWPADWQPEHIQRGAGPFPLCWPETRAVAEFILDRPNIAGVQAYHNAGGMILRGPGHPSRQSEYGQDDDRIAERIGQLGERLLPFYRNLVIHKDLYGVHGGFIGWTYEHLGIFSYTNELWNNQQLLAARPDASGGLESAIGGRQQDQLFASDRLMMGAQYVEWKPAEHPQFGAIEIGGFVKESGRVPPPFMLEELCHRNTAFVLYHADQMPRVVLREVDVEEIGDEVIMVTALVENTRSIPTRSGQARRRNIGLPDTLSLSGEGIEVLGGGVLVNKDFGEVEPAERDPGTIRLPNGINGDSSVRVRWYASGKGKATVQFSSQKGGVIEKEINLD